MHPAYFDTRFRGDQRVDSWPDDFVIISAYATTGAQWTEEENALADQQLEVTLRTRCADVRRIAGYSPETGHKELGWACRIPMEEACEIGVEFKQDAIYVVEGGVLSVTLCDERRALVRVAMFAERLDGTPH